MTSELRAGPVPDRADLRAAQRRQLIFETELPRVRAHATAWRNSLAGLLATLIGFSLIRGRSDISQLTPAWAAVVGLILLVALISGAVGALSLIRAASGRLGVQEALERGSTPAPLADHEEAMASLAAFRRGRFFTLLCAATLIAAVATTWYGPERQSPKLRITTTSGDLCGSVLRVNNGTMTLVSGGEITISLDQIVGMRAVPNCDH